jgi:hypothetical protein
MHARPLHLWLLALTFVVGQWLAVVHGVQHRVSAGEQLVACEVCAVGQAAAGPPLAALPLALLPARSEVPNAVPAAPAARDLPLHPPSRGPPRRLA